MRFRLDWRVFERVSVRIALGIFALAVLLYAKTARYGYAWDDAIVITENARVQQGLTGLPSHWTKHNSAMLQDQYGFRPVTMTTFGIEYGIFGDNPAIPHLTNALLYGLLCVLVFAALRRVLPQLGLWVVTAATLVYVLHPLHVEAVANIKSRDEILGFALSLCSLLLVLRYYQLRQVWHLVGAIVTFVLAFLSKESAVMMLPLIGLAILMQPGSFKRKMVFLLSLPVFALAAFALYRWADGSSAAMPTTEGMGILQESLGLGNPILGAPNDNMFLPTQSALPLRYLREFFWPWPLTYYAGYNQVPLSDWEEPIVGFSLSAVGWWLVFALVLLVWRKDKTLLFAWGVFVSYLLLYAHFVRPLADLMADRFMLAPSLGVCLMMAWVIGWLLGISRVNAGLTASKVGPKALKVRLIVYATLIGAFALLMGYRTWERTPAWRDNLSLFSTDIPHLQNCARCHVHYAGALLQEFQRKGGPAGDAARIVSEYETGIALSPSVYYGRIELTQFHYSQKQYPAGVAVMEAAVRQFPDQARPLYFLGYGEYFLGKYAVAAAHLAQSWEMAPAREDAPYFLAWSYFFDGRQDEAIALAQQCTLRFPQNDQFHDAWSDFLFGTERVEEGFAVLKAAVGRFHSKLLYQKIVQRYTESGQPELANVYREEGRRHGAF